MKRESQQPALTLEQHAVRDIQEGVEACARGCEYFSVCGGGAPVNKLSENGSFRSTRTVFCAMTQMAPVDVVLAAVDRHEALV